MNIFTRTFHALQLKTLVDRWRFEPFPMIKEDTKLDVIAVDHLHGMLW